MLRSGVLAVAVAAVIAGIGAGGVGGVAAAGAPKEVGGGRVRVAVVVPRDPHSFDAYFAAGPGVRYAGYRVAAALPEGKEHVYLVLESE